MVSEKGVFFVDLVENDKNDNIVTFMDLLSLFYHVGWNAARVYNNVDVMHLESLYERNACSLTREVR